MIFMRKNNVHQNQNAITIPSSLSNNYIVVERCSSYFITTIIINNFKYLLINNNLYQCVDYEYEFFMNQKYNKLRQIINNFNLDTITIYTIFR